MQVPSVEVGFTASGFSNAGSLQHAKRDRAVHIGPAVADTMIWLLACM